MKKRTGYLLPPIYPKSIQIGENHQAQIPELISGPFPTPKQSRTIAKEEILWKPGHCKEEDIKLLIKRIFELTKINPLFLDKEKFLFYLMEFNYNMNFFYSVFEKKALSRHVISVKRYDKQKNFNTEMVSNQMFDEGEICISCKDGGNLMLCDYNGCSLAYHNYCVNLTNIPEKEWFCPAHFCEICKESNDFDYCIFCGKNRCSKHRKDNNEEIFKTLKGKKKFSVCLDCFKKDNCKEVDNKNFLYRIFVYNKKVGEVIKSIPLIAQRVPDLYKFFISVNNLGGFAKVLKKDLWKNVAVDLTMPCNQSNFVSLRNVYYSIMYKYENFFMERKEVVEANWKQIIKKKSK